MGSSQSITLTTGPAAANTHALTWVLTALILAACALWAWRRRRFSPAQRVQGRWSRAAISSASFAGAGVVLMVSESLGDQSIGSLFAISVVGFILFGLAAFLLISIIEVVTWRAGASRSRFWLVAATFMFGAAFALPVVGVSLGFGTGLSELADWDILQFVAVIVGASLIWWSYLPARSTEVGRLFE